MDTKHARKVSARYIATIDELELAVRMIEASAQMKRPPGKTASEALDGLPDEEREAIRRSAHAAMIYWSECITVANSAS